MDSTNYIYGMDENFLCTPEDTGYSNAQSRPFYDACWSQPRMPFGVYAGWSVSEVGRVDPWYCVWLLRKLDPSSKLYGWLQAALNEGGCWEFDAASALDKMMAWKCKEREMNALEMKWKCMAEAGV